ncbi:hypothetical protein J1605_012702 [Eschrichtius robustus]|uniref:Uncharacterized protein n=1 Tax=Eschrichtius robustus TaxID=9764 RepID=A0AB34GKD6_ESCRO|nr:hypothetical protein J1605_012702 [Eschrichtius robustus]
MTAAPSVRGELRKDTENYVQARGPDWPVHLQLCRWSPKVKVKGFIVHFSEAPHSWPPAPPLLSNPFRWDPEPLENQPGNCRVFTTRQPGSGEVTSVWVRSPASPLSPEALVWRRHQHRREQQESNGDGLSAQRYVKRQTEHSHRPPVPRTRTGKT